MRRARAAEFDLAVDALGSGPDLAYVVEPGTIERSIGMSSADRQPAGTLEIVGEGATPVVRAMSAPATTTAVPPPSDTTDVPATVGTDQD